MEKDNKDIMLSRALHLASLGGSSQMIASLLGITKKEYLDLENSHPDLFREIWTGKASVALEAIENLHRLATTSDNVVAIKSLLANLDHDYKENTGSQVTLNQQNNYTLKLPSTQEALAAIQADPSIIDVSEEPI